MCQCRAQVTAAATALHGGGCLHVLAFSDGKAQIITASGDIAASARVFDSGAAYVCFSMCQSPSSHIISQHLCFDLRGHGPHRVVERGQLLHHRYRLAGALVFRLKHAVDHTLIDFVQPLGLYSDLVTGISREASSSALASSHRMCYQ